HPEARLDRRPALHLRRQDLERVLVDLAVKGRPGVESLHQTGQRTVEQFEERLVEVADHELADEVERGLAVRTHERAPTVISRHRLLPRGKGRAGAYHIQWATIG